MKTEKKTNQLSFMILVDVTQDNNHSTVYIGKKKKKLVHES